MQKESTVISHDALFLKMLLLILHRSCRRFPYFSDSDFCWDFTFSSFRIYCGLPLTSEYVLETYRPITPLQNMEMPAVKQRIHASDGQPATLSPNASVFQMITKIMIMAMTQNTSPRIADSASGAVENASMPSMA